MRVRTMGIAAIAASVTLVIGAAVAMAVKTNADAQLNGYKEVPAISTTGGGRFEAEIGNSEVSYTLRYHDLEGGDVLFAHIHFGRPATNGDVIAFLCGGGDKPACPASGTVQGVIDASDVIGPEDQGIAPGEFQELVRAIRRNAAYVNVHTEGFPTGEVRGNVIPS
ncbi:MAG TPA: CHRD domain-containing protein [Actinomycetota bacterium]|nr:CHRD domain-containing protein [Actinomycetota bacterium]